MTNTTHPAPAHADQPAVSVDPITASLMTDDSGDTPAYCVMAAYRNRADAEAIFAAIHRSDPVGALSTQASSKIEAEALIDHVSDTWPMGKKYSLDQIESKLRDSLNDLRSKK